MPALAMRMSRRPCCETMASMATCAACWSVTSKGEASAFNPRPCSVLTAVSSVATLRPLRATIAPTSARPSAIARPSPREAPVMSATRPSRENNRFSAVTIRCGPAGIDPGYCARASISRKEVRFGSKADMCSAKGHFRFSPESGHSQA